MDRTSGNLETFTQHLRETLTHLYDPTHQPDAQIWQVTGCQPQEGVQAVQAVIRQAIEALRPPENTPATARIRRLYQILRRRYFEGLTQEETAHQLGITPRHIRREQQPAIETLARYLWDQRQSSRLDTPATETTSNRLEPQPIKPTTWRSQVQAELAALQRSTPGAITDLAQVINGLANLGRTLTTRHGVALEISPVPSDLTTTVHPITLRQILLTAIEKLVQHMTSGQIHLQVEARAKAILINVQGHPANVSQPLSSDFISEILEMQGGSAAIQMEDGQITFQLILPPAKKITVLVVDDNLDLIHFYRRYTAKTRYEVVHITAGGRLFPAIEKWAPELIVLDVMLPDVDGWELLTTLHEHPDTRSIPVIVCSVVRREELALALGAAKYISKPIRRQQFIHALDQAISHHSEITPKSPESNATVD